MSHPIGTYSFLPWLRQGIANQITARDLDPSVRLRATVPVELELLGNGLNGGTLTEPISRNIQLYGPGDIVGIDSRAIIRTEPRNWITNFESNYLPLIEFYDEDFPWRYTPAAPDRGLHRLRPWIMLVVLKEDEFEEGKNIKDKPLPFIAVENAATVFPPAEQLWSWAHVHINSDLAANIEEIVSTDMDSVIPKLGALLDENHDLAYSRIVCPRKLEANAAYHTFLIPVFESGRLAGLGLEIPAETPATKSAWGEDQTEFPFYYRWYFRTGTVGDFEYLVRLLEPQPAKKEVGNRPMDTQNSGSNLSGITDAELGGVLKLGGALQVPFKTMPREDKLEVLKYENWDRLDQLEALSDEEKDELLDKDTVERLQRANPHPFQTELAAFISLADDYAVKSDEQAKRESDNLNETLKRDPDPLITPPLYGRWHALTHRLLEDREGSSISPNDNWVHELNLDPRFRVASGFGTKVVLKSQEEYMNAAWEQIGEILEANRKIRQAQLAKEVSSTWYKKHLLPLLATNSEKAFLFTTPVQKRVVKEGLTVYRHVNTSVVPYAITSMPVRRVLRPRGRLMTSLKFDGRVQPNNLIERINTGEVTAGPPKKAPEGVTTIRDISELLLPKNAPTFVIDWLRRLPWLRYAPLVLALLILLILLIFALPTLSLITLGIVVAGGAWLLYQQLSSWSQQVDIADSILEENQIPEAVDKLPKSPDFVITEPGDPFTPTQGNTDSPEAIRYKTALKDLYTVLVASRSVSQEPPRKQLNLPDLTSTVVQSINPEITIPYATFQNVRLPAHLKASLGEEFKEVMAYPEIDIPMYKPLAEISSELFLPNLNFIAQNSITLLETNQRFIEAYMVGLNHEFARELLWREYPTDQRGSYFRQFWDPSSSFNTENLSNEEFRESLYDAPPFHLWSKLLPLGNFDNRELSGEKEEEAVLVIRGELLKKYPTAVIYAHRAQWQRNADGTIDNTKERLLVELTSEEEENPPGDKVKSPLYEAKVEPDIYFFGFDLTAEEARGGTGEHDEDDAGWYFVIKERPGEPRIGLDINKAPALHNWSDLSWEDLAVEPGAFIDITNGRLPPALSEPPRSGEAEAEARHNQYIEDSSVRWDRNINSADLAYILYQVPVMVAVHAAELLPRE